MSGDSDVRRMIKTLRGIPGMAAESAPECAEAVDSAIKTDLAAGRSPDGEAFAPRKDGAAALPNAASNATLTRAVGTTLVTASQFPYGFHQIGARGMPIRKVVPTAISERMAAGIKRVLDAQWEKRVRGG